MQTEGAHLAQTSPRPSWVLQTRRKKGTHIRPCEDVLRMGGRVTPLKRQVLKRSQKPLICRPLLLSLSKSITSLLPLSPLLLWVDTCQKPQPIYTLLALLLCPDICTPSSSSQTSTAEPACYSRSNSEMETALLHFSCLFLRTRAYLACYILPNPNKTKLS